VPRVTSRHEPFWASADVGIESFDAIVIGAGINGLVAAAALGRAGRKVLVLERAERIGGQVRVEEFAPGFKAGSWSSDAGWVPPSIIETFNLKLDLVTPDVPLSVRGPAGSLALASDPGRLSETLRPLSRTDADRWPQFATRVHRVAGFLEALYQLPAIDIATTSLRELVALLGVGRRFRSLGREDMTEVLRILPMSIQELLDDWFETSLLKAALGVGGVQDLRQGPRSGGTAFVFLHHLTGAPLGSMRGRGYWRAGPDALVGALDERAKGYGVSIRSQAKVAQILVREDAVAGVMLETGEEIRASVVVSTADPATTLRGMVDPVWLDPEFLRAVGNIKYRGCTAFVLYAMERLPESLGGPDPLDGVVSLTTDLVSLERASDAAKYGAVSDHPHVEYIVPTARWPALAPPGKHVILARVQYAPYALGEGAEWDASASDRLGHVITTALERAHPEFEDRVLYRQVVTPRDLERRDGLTQGALSQGELTLDQILFMRPVPGWARHRMPIAGLYLGGSGTHPGPGIAGGAGWLAARAVLDDR